MTRSLARRAARISLFAIPLLALGAVGFGGGGDEITDHQYAIYGSGANKTKFSNGLVTHGWNSFDGTMQFAAGGFFFLNNYADSQNYNGDWVNHHSHGVARAEAAAEVVIETVNPGVNATMHRFMFKNCGAYENALGQPFLFGATFALKMKINSGGGTAKTKGKAYIGGYQM